MRQIIDAHFEVISGPRRQLCVLTLARRIYFWTIVGTALFTLGLGLLGADIDTRPEEPVESTSAPIKITPVSALPAVR